MQLDPRAAAVHQHRVALHRSVHVHGERHQRAGAGDHGRSAAPPPRTSRSNMYGLYVQDDWRVTDRLTLNLGVRWDYVDGMPLDQDSNPNFVAMQAAGRAGRFAGTALEDFGQRAARRQGQHPAARRLRLRPARRRPRRRARRLGHLHRLRLHEREHADGGVRRGRRQRPRLPRAAIPPGCGSPTAPVPRRRSALVDRVAEPGQPEPPAAAGARGVAAARAAVHAPDEPRLGARARRPDGA